MCCVMHVKEPRTLIVKEKGLAPVFLDSRLEHPAGWICAALQIGWGAETLLTKIAFCQHDLGKYAGVTEIDCRG